MPFRGSIVLALLGLLLTLAGPAAAQHLPPSLAPLELATTPRLRFPAPDTASRRDFRWLGTAIGAAGLGLFAGLEASAACGNSESGPRDCTGVTIGVGLLGATVGGALGYLAGRAVHR